MGLTWRGRLALMWVEKYDLVSAPPTGIELSSPRPSCQVEGLQTFFVPRTPYDALLGVKMAPKMMLIGCWPLTLIN